MEEKKSTKGKCTPEPVALSDGLVCPCCGESSLEECRHSAVEFYGEDDYMTATVFAQICFKCRFVESVWT